MGAAEKVIKMSVLQDLEAGVAVIKQAVADAVAKFQSLAVKVSVANADGDEEAIESIAQELKSTAATLEAAVNPPAPTADPAPATDPTPAPAA